MLGGLCFVLAYAAVAQGGFYAPQATLVAVVALAVALLSRGGGDAKLPTLGFVAMAVGLTVASAAAGWSSAGVPAAAGLLSAAAAFRAGREVVRGGRRHALLAALAWVATGLGALGIIGVAAHVEPLAMRATGLWRAASTITYANGLALVLVLCLPAATLLSRRGGWLVRLPVYVILAGIAATMSRGGLLALGVLLTAFAVLGGRTLILPVLRPLLGATVFAVGLLPSLSARQPRPGLALAGFVIGAAVALPAAPSAWARRGMESGRSGTYHLGTGVETELGAFARRVAALFPERDVSIEHGPTRPGDIHRNCADISAAREAFGYQPTTAVDEGLARTADWFRDSYADAPR